MYSLSWLGKTLCPPDFKSDIKAPSCAAIFRLGIVMLQCVCTGEVFCGLHVAYIHIICPVHDVTHVRKCTRPGPLPLFRTASDGKLGGGLGTRLKIFSTSTSLNWPLLHSKVPHCLHRHNCLPVNGEITPTPGEILGRVCKIAGPSPKYT